MSGVVHGTPFHCGASVTCACTVSLGRGLVISRCIVASEMILMQGPLQELMI